MIGFTNIAFGKLWPLFRTQKYSYQATFSYSTSLRWLVLTENFLINLLCPEGLEFPEIHPHWKGQLCTQTRIRMIWSLFVSKMCDYMTSLYQHWTIKHWPALSSPLQCPSATENTVHLIGLVLDCSWLSLYCALFQLRRISRNDSILFTAATLVTCSMMKWSKHTKIKHCSQW